MPIDVDRIKELIEEILDKYELAQAVQEKLQQILDRLEEGAPDFITAADLLACLIESLGEKMPPVISDFITTYVAALRAGIDSATFLACIRYNLLRRWCFTHEEACRIAALRDEICKWCHLRWLLDRLPPVYEEPEKEGEEGTTTPPPPVDELLPPLPEGPTWGEEFDDCCSGLKEAERSPKVTFNKTVRRGPGNIKLFSGELVIEHQCGLIRRGVKVTLLISNRIREGERGSVGFGQPHAFEKFWSSDGKKVTYRFTDYEIAMDDANSIEVIAVSNCYGLYKRPIPIDT